MNELGHVDPSTTTKVYGAPSRRCGWWVVVDGDSRRYVHLKEDLAPGEWFCRCPARTRLVDSQGRPTCQLHSGKSEWRSF